MTKLKKKMEIGREGEDCWTKRNREASASMKEKAMIFDGEGAVDEEGQYRPRMREVAEEEETQREGDI